MKSSDYDPGLHHRRSIRLPWYDYARKGMYFVTVCTQEMRCLFGTVGDRLMHLNESGECIAGAWDDIPGRFPGVDLDYSVVMPNHIHGIVMIVQHTARQDQSVRQGTVSGIRGESGVRPFGTLPGSLSRIIQAFKSITTGAYVRGVKDRGWPPFQERLWQRGYFEHIIRDERELYLIRRYIAENPRRWEMDNNNPSATGSEDRIPWEA